MRRISLTARHRAALGRLAVAALPALMLASCKTMDSVSGAFDGQPAASEVTGSIAPGNRISNTTLWAKRWQKNTGDVDTALKYAASLRALGSDSKALAVLRQTTAQNPKNPLILGEYGKQLAVNGFYRDAVHMLQRALTAGPPDWRLYSAQGTVLDRMGQGDRARQYYASALKLAPENPVILNNLGMSYALSGKLDAAEATLARAIKQPNAQPRVRQNLALVIGLQGRFEDAKKVASHDLEPEQVEVNLAYMRKMLSQPDMWSALKAQQKPDGARAN